MHGNFGVFNGYSVNKHSSVNYTEQTCMGQHTLIKILFSGNTLGTRTQATHLIKTRQKCHTRRTSSYKMLFLFGFKENGTMPTKFINIQYKISRE
jgi:hypothetical protein